MDDAPRYRVPARLCRIEQEVLRSRFVTSLARATTADEARAFVAAVRAEMPDASHHCWAFVAGPPGSTAAIGLSDDGEPHGTAGKPMLTALLHSHLGEVVAVVTRYFGGTLLGKGGLVRAYTAGVVEALAAVETVERVRRARLAVEIEYPRYETVKRLLPGFEATVQDETFGATVGLRVELPAGRIEAFTQALLDATAGDALCETVDLDPA
jgi:uncharacterized YigZ family protein